LGSAIQEKRRVVAEINSAMNGTVAVVIADYRGLSANDFTALRMRAKSANVSLRVVRNALARRAVRDTRFDCLQEAFKGPVLLGFSNDELSAPAKLFRSFIKENHSLEVKAISLGDELLDADKIDLIAGMPDRNEALAQLLCILKAPMTQLAQALLDIPGQVVRAIEQVGKSRSHDSEDT